MFLFQFKKIKTRKIMAKRKRKETKIRRKKKQNYLLKFKDQLLSQ
jgi:hypothetical protein